jgi:hypothetical protein
MVNAQEPKLRIEPRNTKGSTENVPLLEASKVDLALVAGEIATAALAKPGRRCGLLPRCIRRRECSWFAPTARTGRSPT